MASTALSKPVPDMSVRGVPGLVSFGGFVQDEWLNDLQGPRGRRVLREMMDQDAIIGAILFSLEMLIRQMPWTIEPGDKTPEAQAHADFVDSCLHDMTVTFDETISEILTFLGYGFSFHEILFKRRDGQCSAYNDGKIGWQGWPMRGQETLLRWEFDPVTWDATAMVQLGAPDYVEHIIPVEKALHFRTTTKRNNPEGRSLIRNCVRAYYLKKHIETIEAIGIERDAAGIPIVWVPPEILNGEADSPEAAILTSMKATATGLKTDDQAGLVFPLAYDEDGNKIYDLTLLTSPGNRSVNIDPVIARYDQRMTMTTMSDFLTLGHERVGSNALAETKGKLFVAALGAWTSTICGVINTRAIPQLLRLNGIVTETPPKLTHGRIERTDEDILSNVILRLMQAGARLDLSAGSPFLNSLLDMFGLPMTNVGDPYTPPPPRSARTLGDEEPNAPEQTTGKPIEPAPKTPPKPNTNPTPDKKGNA